MRHRRPGQTRAVPPSLPDLLSGAGSGPLSRHLCRLGSRLLWVSALAAVGLVGAGGCASELQGKLSGVRDGIKTARDSGAYRCAPRELAMAEAHAAFTELELRQGNYFRAREELDVASENARLAIARSPRDKCAPSAVTQPAVKDSDGDGLRDDIDKCPFDPEDFDNFQDEDGCPELDNDTDGVLDAVDRCPLEPEDKDGFADQDGCPDTDNDQDTIPDLRDKCPNDPGPADNEGCPLRYKLIVVTGEKIELLQKIFFDFNKATIKPVSFPLLDEVAQALRDYPTIHVRIEGHTDSRGGDRYNLRLSQARAGSVRQYLVRAGIEGSRMVARGYGKTQPIASNRTAAGRDQNRRVEFFITRR